MFLHSKTMALFALVLAASNSALSATVTLDATDSGWYRSDGVHTPQNQNYQTGFFDGTERRSFFVFDLSTVSGTVTAATLRLFNPLVSPTLTGYQSPDPSETLEIYDVTTSAASVTGAAAGVGGFSDFGSGTLYGSKTVSAADNGTVVEIVLNASAVAAIDSGSGLFLLGGALSTLSGTENQYVFGFSTASFAGDDVRQLVLEVREETPIPEPSTVGLTVLGALAFLGRRSWRPGRQCGGGRVGS